MPLRDSGRAGDIMDGVPGAVEFDSLMAAREKARTPLPSGYWLRVAPTHARHDHEPGKVLTVATETIVDPRPHGGAAADGRPGVHEGMGRVMIDLLGKHRFHDTDLVSHLSMVGKKIGDELSFSELLEFREVTLDLEMLALQPVSYTHLTLPTNREV